MPSPLIRQPEGQLFSIFMEATLNGLHTKRHGNAGRNSQNQAPHHAEEQNTKTRRKAAEHAEKLLK
jgi:hypothetical protein